MSLLLEALRKAERDRDRGGAAPDFDAIIQRAQGESQAELRRWRWIAGVTAVIAATAAVFGIWVGLQQAPAPAEPAVEQATSAPIPVAQTPVPPVVSGDLQSLDDMTPSRAPPPPTDLETEPAYAEETLPVEDLAQAPLPEPEPEPEPNLEPEPPSVQRITLEPAPTPPVPRLQEMTPAYRADFPPLKVDVHVWNRDPAQRFVLVNGKRYREGEALREGPLLVEITDDGLLLSHRGERVLLPLER